MNNDTKYRVVIKDLREPDSPVVRVAGDVGPAEARRIRKNFMRARWTERRPDVNTIDHVALVVERDVPMDRPQAINAALLQVLKDIVAISDRKHDAWDRAHALIDKAEALL